MARRLLAASVGLFFAACLFPSLDGLTATLWMTDTPAALLTSVPTQPSPPYSVFHLEASFWQAAVAQPAVDVWIDDVMVDSQRIGCAK